MCEPKKLAEVPNVNIGLVLVLSCSHDDVDVIPPTRHLSLPILHSTGNEIMGFENFSSSTRPGEWFTVLKGNFTSNPQSLVISRPVSDRLLTITATGCGAMSGCLNDG